MPDDSIGDLPPVWIPRWQFPPMPVAKFVFLMPQPPAKPETVAVALIGRPDDQGTEPSVVVAVDPDLAEDLALNLIRVAADVRRAR